MSRTTWNTKANVVKMGNNINSNLIRNKEENRNYAIYS